MSSSTDSNSWAFFFSVAGLIISAVGFVVNLWFNCINYRRASEFRSASLKFDEFKRHRSNLDSALLPLKKCLSDLRALDSFVDDISSLKIKIDVINKECADAYTNMNYVLRGLDLSEFQISEGWQASSGQKWDDLVAHFDRVHAPKYSNIEDMRKLIKEAYQKLDLIISHIVSVLEGESRKYAR